MQVLTVKEVADYLKCSVSSIRNMVRNNEIPYFRIGAKLNFNREAVDNWVHNQEMQSVQKCSQKKKYKLEVLKVVCYMKHNKNSKEAVHSHKKVITASMNNLYKLFLTIFYIIQVLKTSTSRC